MPRLPKLVDVATAFDSAGFTFDQDSCQPAMLRFISAGANKSFVVFFNQRNHPGLSCSVRTVA